MERASKYGAATIAPATTASAANRTTMSAIRARYGEEAPPRLRFAKGARRLGLRIEDVRQPLAVRDCWLCLCGQAEAIGRERLVEVEARLEHLAALGDAPANLLER
jgi:MerR, DNA binding